jgi:penicillin-binding protein 1A
MNVLLRLAVYFNVILRPTSWRNLESRLCVSVARHTPKLKRRLPTILTSALVLGEDRRFYNHPGVDPIANLGAIWRFVVRGKVSGASTIEQQLVRVLTGDSRRDLRRKGREMILACAMDTLYEKYEIVEMYMAVAYFGWQMNGVEEACLRMCIDLSTMTPRQAAGIVARLKYPEPRFPSPERSALIARRTEHILGLLSPTDIPSARNVSSNTAFLDARLP